MGDDLMRGIVDPRLMGALESHFPDRCTVQCLTETVDADGQVVKTWTDRHTDVPCNVMPLKGREIKRPNQTYVVANTSIALQGHYPISSRATGRSSAARRTTSCSSSLRSVR
jgi:head-tail adaptor